MEYNSILAETFIYSNKEKGQKNSQKFKHIPYTIFNTKFIIFQNLT